MNIVALLILWVTVCNFLLELTPDNMVWLLSKVTTARAFQTERMTCFLGNKSRNCVPFQENIQFLVSWGNDKEEEDSVGPLQ